MSAEQTDSAVPIRQWDASAPLQSPWKYIKRTSSSPFGLSGVWAKDWPRPNPSLCPSLSSSCHQARLKMVSTKYSSYLLSNSTTVNLLGYFKWKVRKSRHTWTQLWPPLPLLNPWSLLFFFNTFSCLLFIILHGNCPLSHLPSSSLLPQRVQQWSYTDI